MTTLETASIWTTGLDSCLVKETMTTPTKPDVESYLRLEGTPPDCFNGNYERTLQFLTQFKRFMLMNDDATILRNPIKRCAYFLSLIEGSKVEGWTERSYEWLDKLQAKKTTLPFGMTAWEALKQDFRNAFVDYAEHERAADELKKLRMTEGRIDEYIASFERLAHRANADLNDPLNLCLFARGLPSRLCNTCIDINSPESFEQWAKAAQHHQRNWLRKQAIKAKFGESQPPQQSNAKGQWCRNDDFGAFHWRQTENDHDNRTSPRSSKLMNASTTVRRATSETDKDDYCRTGRCFTCRTQGHLACDCSTKVPQQNPNNRADDYLDGKSDDTSTEDDNSSLTAATLAALTMRLSDDEKEVFARSLHEIGAGLGFPNA